MCIPIMWPIRTTFATMITHFSFSASLLNTSRYTYNSLCSGNICHMLQKDIEWCWWMCLLRGKIKQLVMKWTGMLVESHQSYDDLDCFNSYGGHLELWLSLHLVGQARYILQTIRITWMNGQYIWVSETLMWQLDQSLWSTKASLLLIFPFFWNITLQNMENNGLEGMTSPQSRGFEVHL
jgi:hypothetical protein